MTTPAIMDIIVVALFAFFTIWGARRGLFRSLAGLVIVIAALVGASMIASTFSAPAAKLLSPLVERHIETRVENLVSQPPQTPPVEMPEAPVETPKAEGLSLDQLLTLLGLDANFTDTLAKQAQEKIQSTGVSIAMAVVESLAQSVIHAVLFSLSFLVLMLLLNVLMRAMDLVLKLPGLHLLNGVGGAIFGLAEGTLLLLLALWLAQRMGYSVEKLTEDTILFKIFATHAPFGLLSFIQ